MTKFAIRSLLTLLISFGLFAGYAAAENHGRHGWGGGDRVRREHARERHEWREQRREHREVREHRERWNHERMERERRARWEREHHRPAGWDHGRKTGWNGGAVPPGHDGRPAGGWIHPSGSAPTNHASAPVIAQAPAPQTQAKKVPSWWPSRKQ